MHGNALVEQKGKTMIKPTIGRKIWFWPSRDWIREKGLAAVSGQPHDATIVAVWSDTCVNLACFDANGHPYPCTSAYLYQEDAETPKPDSHFAEWMPYQKAQTAKHEALEAQLKTG
jgi:hypothetical protein